MPKRARTTTPYHPNGFTDIVLHVIQRLFLGLTAIGIRATHRSSVAGW